MGRGGGGRTDSLQTDRGQREPAEVAPPWASVRQKFYGLFMQARISTPAQEHQTAAAPALTPWLWDPSFPSRAQRPTDFSHAPPPSPEGEMTGQGEASLQER